MKRRNIIDVLLLVLTLTLTTNVYAKTDKYGNGDTYSGTIVVSPSIPTDASNKAGGYSRHDNTLTLNGVSGSFKAYCINPNASAKITSGSNAVTCRKTTAQSYPMSTYLANHAGTADAETLDLAYRMLGMMDNGIEQVIDAGEIDEQYTLGNTNKQRNGAATIVTTFEQYVLGIDHIHNDPGGFGGFVLQGGKVEAAAALAKAAYANMGKGGGAGADSNFVTGAPAVNNGSATGTNFTITSGARLGPLSRQYTITSKSACSNVTAESDTPGLSVSLSWSGSSGTLTATAADFDSCSGSVSLTCDGAAASADAPVGDTSSGSNQILRCSIAGSSSQSFIAVVPGLPGDDVFSLADLCECGEGHPDFNALTGTCEGCPCGDVPPPSEIEGDANNCCETGGHGEFKQQLLNNLFCPDEKPIPMVDHWEPKCGAELYIEEAINDYCDMYCRQEAEYDIPPVTHSRAGRFFSFAKHAGYVMGDISGVRLSQTKNCRTIIKWHLWYKDYKAQLQTEVDLYNSTEMNTSHYLVWDDAIKANDKVTEDTSGEVSWTASWPQVMQGLVEIQASGSSSGSVSVASKYGAAGEIDTFILGKFAPKKERRYKSVKIGYNKMSETDYKYITVEHAGGHTADSSTYHRDTQVEAYENKYKSAADSAYSQAEADCNAAIAGKKDATCDIGDKPDPHQYNPKNPEETRQSYKDAADSASEGLVGAAKEMIQIKKDLNDCDNYIYKKMEYATTPDMDFSYTQGYLNDYGKFVNDNVGIDFDKDCVAEKHYGLENLKYEDGKFGDRLGSPVTDVDGYPMSSSQGCDKGADAGGCDADRHSNSVYKTWDENAKDFDDEKQLPTDKLDDPDQEKSHEGWLYGEWFEARKPFTTDGYINVKCDWTDSDSNNLYSLVPSGAVISVEEYKYTHHGQEYYTKKTHITGKFETYFTLSTVGEYGLFDPYVNSGNTCAGDTGNATCVIIIDREITIPPHCNTVVKSGADICEVCPDVNCDNPNVKVTYEFKEVDTSNLFPSQTSSGYPGNYGWNWFSGPNGQTTRNYIESNSRDTFDPRTQLSYSFTLTTSDMREIRAYNRSRTVYGGYTDFVMTCANEGEKDVAKHHCYSKFLEAISGGSGLPYDSKTLSLDTANVDLSTARSKGAWYPSSY